MRAVACFCVFMVTMLCASTSFAQELADIPPLAGAAEDLWGNKIDLGAFDKGVVLIHPISPANCGYCLIDGYFIRENYLRNNEEAGGRSFLMCLFNPQLDVYTYTKHYREAATPVLAFPPALHAYHRDGFPFMIAFRDGKCCYSGVAAPYEEKFHSLSLQLWPDKHVPLTPTSPVFMSLKFTTENETQLAVFVVPDGDKQELERLKQRFEKSSAITVKRESDLTEDDLKKNLWFQGGIEGFKFTALAGQVMPISVTPSKLTMGEYEFPAESVGFTGCFPNPHNRERYVQMEISTVNGGRPAYEDYADFVVSRQVGGHCKVLVHGFFKKEPGNVWEFSESLALSSEALAQYRKKPAQPSTAAPAESPAAGGEKAAHASGQDTGTAGAVVAVSDWVKAPYGATRTFGSSACRFPSLAVDAKGVCWTAWEEGGGIFLASVSGPEPQKTVVVEKSAADSFNPVAAFDGSALWVFYLSDDNGIYRLYAKRLEDGRLSDAILITEKGLCDAITPAVASDGKGRVIAAWSEWKANYRYLRYRVIDNQVLGQIQDAAIKKPDNDYENAWFPSLTFEGKGRPWGAWNQHYPAILGVCAGDLENEASSVTAIYGNINDNENGGYPSIAVAPDGKRWVVWESFGWDVVITAGPQRILASCYDEKAGKWEQPFILSLDETNLNQTPKAVTVEDGTIWAVWSGRGAEPSTWGLYLSKCADGKWSAPVQISSDGETARAPAVVNGKAGEIWVAWHCGIGSAMRIKVLHLDNEKLGNLTWPKERRTISPLIEKLSPQELERLQKMSAEEVARAFLQACADGDWETAWKLDSVKSEDGRKSVKERYAGLTIVSVGKSFQDKKTYRGFFVPYEIRLKTGEVQKQNMALTNETKEARFILDGGI